MNNISYEIEKLQRKNIVEGQVVEKSDYPSFHKCFGPVMAVVQFFALLPINGVLSDSEDFLEFRWKSIRVIYAMLFLFCGTVESCLGTRRLLRLGFNIHFAEGLLFFITAMVKSFLMFRLGKNWKKIIRFWRKCEDVFLRAPYRSHSNLKLKIQLTFGILFVFAIGKISS